MESDSYRPGPLEGGRTSEYRHVRYIPVFLYAHRFLSHTPSPLVPLALTLLRVGCMSVHFPVVSCCPPLLLLLLLPLLEIACLLHPPCLLSSRLLLSLRAAAVEQSDGIQLFCFVCYCFPLVYSPWDEWH
ncbi:hypothetical protein P167DRAFT_36415 [Morchella conica CCBAS932]|uniref:Uncharacterized protein n=1 Tax=Morchella conica CCBAS932 TaxID=1392247 RepID=A0A3N4KEI5_9PEZI|nr:hypothetical protein P167DRAFT_36415 [Morchella conica CCBAS932]